MNIVFFTLLAAAATIIGGSIPLLHKKLSEKQLTILIAFSAGILLSTGLNHMMVESFAKSGHWAVIAMSAGFIFLYSYEKFSMVHACREQNCHVHHFGNAALIGIGFHSFLDGFAIAVSFELQRTLGLFVISAVVLHRLPTGISLAAILLSHHYTSKKAWITLIIIASLAVVGAVAGQALPAIGVRSLSMAVGLAGGTFLYISTSDLLPMAHENVQDYRVPIFFLIGFLGILIASMFQI